MGMYVLYVDRKFIILLRYWLSVGVGPFQRHVCDQKKWKISLLNGYSSWYKHAINKFLIDNSASCSSQDIQVFEN